MRRIAEGNPGEYQHDGELRDDDPATAAPEKGSENRRVVSVEERRPNEFEFVGNGELTHQPDRLDRNLRLRQPSGLRRIDKKIRNAGAEAEPQHRRVTAVGQQMGKKGILFGSLLHFNLSSLTWSIFSINCLFGSTKGTCETSVCREIAG